MGYLTRPDEDEFSFVFSEREVIAPNLNLNWISKRGKTDQFDGSAHEQAHFKKAGALVDRDFDFGDDGGTTYDEGTKGARILRHAQALSMGALSGSTKILSANRELMPNLALHTWQMTLL